MPSEVPVGAAGALRVDYARLFARAEAGGAPALFMAPMENLGDWRLRRALTFSIGGMDEMCTEFVRVPCEVTGPASGMARSLSRRYVWNELVGPGEAWGSCGMASSSDGARADAIPTTPAPADGSCTPLAVQIMGGDPFMLGTVAAAMVARGAPRVDLNCGCPSNIVTGKGAGSSLLLEPDRLHACVRAMVEAVRGRVPVTVKMRAGFTDTGLFLDNARAAEAGGVAFVAVHPRTKVQGYRGRADWSLIRAAREALSIPVIGNGDVVTPERARELVDATGCQGIMVGRGAVQDPLLFWRIRAEFGETGPGQGPGGVDLNDEVEAVKGFLRAYLREVSHDGFDAEGKQEHVRGKVRVAW